MREADFMARKMIKSFFAVLLILIMMSTSVLAAENAETTATRVPYSIALRGAINNLPALTGMDDMIDELYDLRRSLRNLRDVRDRAGSATREELSEMDRQIGELTAQMNTMRITQEILRTSTEFSMRSSMTAIANIELDIKLMEANLELDRLALQNSALRLTAGLISESDFNIAELELQQQEADLAARRVSLETEQQNLNRILQRSIAGNYYVVVDKTLIDLPEDLNGHVRRAAPRQANVRQRDIAVNRARALWNDEVLRFSPERASLERSLNQAQRERAEALRSTETIIRNQYNNLQALNRQNDSLNIELQRANERLEVARLNQQAGRATPYDISRAELAILQIEISLQRNFNNAWNAQFIFENPFLLAN